MHLWTTAACERSDGRRCGLGRCALLWRCEAASADESVEAETLQPFLRMSAACSSSRRTCSSLFMIERVGVVM